MSGHDDARTLHCPLCGLIHEIRHNCQTDADPATLRLGPPADDYPDQATIDAAVEAFLTTYPAGTPDEQGRTGLRRDIAAALSAAHVGRRHEPKHPEAVESLRAERAITKTSAVQPSPTKGKAAPRCPERN